MSDQLNNTLVPVSTLAFRFDGAEHAVLPPGAPPVLKNAILEYVEQLALTRQVYTVSGNKPVST